MESRRDTNRNDTSTAEMSRRKALAKLGLAVGIAYVAPTIVRLDRSANARILPTPCPPPDGNCANNPPQCPC